LAIALLLTPLDQKSLLGSALQIQQTNM